MPVSVTQIAEPNKQIEAANGVRYAYRRYGNAETGSAQARQPVTTAIVSAKLSAATSDCHNALTCTKRTPP